MIIEATTDDIGKEDYNLDLSERRAKSVNDYLISRGNRQASASSSWEWERACLFTPMTARKQKEKPQGGIPSYKKRTMTGIPEFIVFSDLDGTILDHKTYSFDEALEGIRLLKERGVPLVPVVGQEL